MKGRMLYRIFVAHKSSGPTPFLGVFFGRGGGGVCITR